MYRKLLIANRGEIACRIIRTCRRLGIGTVAVYSEADAGARHVREADEAVAIGPAQARLSYLDAGRLVDAALATGAEAIHPGYGFLSEKTDLLDACVGRGLAFIGPHREAIVRMGSKIESKRIARAAGLHCVPGYDGSGDEGESHGNGHSDSDSNGNDLGALDGPGDERTGRLLAEARRIGFPLLIKASAGGGGKGMRRVDRREDFVASLDDARREAEASFGDPRVLLEKLVQRPRHLEVQLWGDRHGQIRHLFERECSIQRHYQKLIEEAPAAHLSELARTRLYDAALALGRTIGYDSVGTVEFVLEAGSDEPWFLEMNTRLQVEHPVTELTTGLDLVECQLRSALGEAITVDQAAIRRDGWAIEARVNAEVPGRDFAPSPGRIHDYDEPRLDGVRIDSGICAGSEVTLHYDSMIAKVIARAATREIATDRLHHALGAFRVDGVQTNQSLLRRILERPAFHTELDTGFLLEQFPDGHGARADQARERRAAAAAAAFFHAAPIVGDKPLETLRGWRLSAPGGLPARRIVEVTDADGSSTVEVASLTADQVRCRIGDASWGYGAHPAGVVGSAGVHRCGHDDTGNVHGWIDGDGGSWRVESALDRATAPAAGRGSAADDAIMAPLPGVVGEFLVTAGEAVVAGQRLGSLEAMKLVHALTAPRDGRIARIAVRPGDTVREQTLLLALEPATAANAPS